MIGKSFNTGFKYNADDSKEGTVELVGIDVDETAYAISVAFQDVSLNGKVSLVS